MNKREGRERWRSRRETSSMLSACLSHFSATMITSLLCRKRKDSYRRKVKCGEDNSEREEVKS